MRHEAKGIERSLPAQSPSPRPFSQEERERSTRPSSANTCFGYLHSTASPSLAVVAVQRRVKGAADAGRERRGARGRLAFTLVELVMVLIILAVLATVALNSVEPQVDQTMFEATQQTIENFDQAILDERLISDGRTIYTGFLVDLGRTPVSKRDGPVFTAAELWNETLFVNKRYEFRTLTPDNILGTTDSGTKDSDQDDIEHDSELVVASGWRGPYLQLAVGGTQLTDGWGTPLVSGSLRTKSPGSSADFPIAAADISIFGVRSFGQDNVADGVPPPTDYSRDIPAATSALRHTADTYKDQRTALKEERQRLEREHSRGLRS